MRPRTSLVLFSLSVLAAAASPAAAQRKPSVTIMPTQYFSADAESAGQITRSLAESFERQGYTVLEASKADQQFSSLGLQHNRQYGDATAVKFGKAMGADLVVYPRLLALGIPASDGSNKGNAPEAVLHLRVLNVASHAPLYCRQVGHQFSISNGSARVQDFHLDSPVATSTVEQATGLYFRSIGGSRQERVTLR